MILSFAAALVLLLTGALLDRLLLAHSERKYATTLDRHSMKKHATARERLFADKEYGEYFG